MKSNGKSNQADIFFFSLIIAIVWQSKLQRINLAKIQKLAYCFGHIQFGLKHFVWHPKLSSRLVFVTVHDICKIFTQIFIIMKTRVVLGVFKKKIKAYLPWTNALWFHNNIAPFNENPNSTQATLKYVLQNLTFL